MKNWIFFLTMVLFSCQSTKQLALPETFKIDKEISREKKDGKIIIKSIRILAGTTMELKKDDTGKYYTVTSPGNKVVFKISVSRVLEVPLADSALMYTLTFETDNPVKSFTKENEDLRDIKAVYGFHAFHPDSGYYPLDKGKISLKTDKKNKKIIITVELPEKYGKMLNGTYEVPLSEN